MTSHFLNSHLPKNRGESLTEASSPLHDGLLAIAAAAKSGVRADVILDLVGWTTDNPLTCAEAGRRHGLSRERVRQMEAAFLLSFSEETPSAWMTVVSHAMRSAPMSRSSLGELCRREDLCRVDEFPWGFVVLLARRGLLGGTVAVTHGRRGLLGDGVQSDRFLRAARSLEWRVRKRGVLNIGPFVSSYPADMAKELVRLLEDINGPAIEDEGIWIFSAEKGWTRRGFGLSIAKMFAVAERLEARDIAAGLSRGPRARCGSFPEGIVGRMATASGVAVLDDDGFYRRAGESHADALAPAERKLFDAMAAMGGSGTRSDIIAACGKSGLNATTVILYLSWAPFLMRSGAAVYELVGTEKRCARPSSGDGCVAFRKKITPSTLRNGVVSLPSDCRIAAPGKVVCTDPSGRLLGHIRIGGTTISGLRRHLRRLSCVAGQTVVIEFESGLAKARLGIEGAPA